MSRDMHTSKPARQGTNVFSRISCGIPTFSLGAKDDLDRFPLINAYLHCNKVRGRKYEVPGAVKRWRQVVVAALHTAPRSSPVLWGQINYFFKWLLYHREQEIEHLLPLWWRVTPIDRIAQAWGTVGYAWLSAFHIQHVTEPFVKKKIFSSRDLGLVCRLLMEYL